jgi:hypothetical protein
VEKILIKATAMSKGPRSTSLRMIVEHFVEFSEQDFPSFTHMCKILSQICVFFNKFVKLFLAKNVQIFFKSRAVYIFHKYPI